MNINEIEITGSSLSTVALICDTCLEVDTLCDVIMLRADKFSIETEIPGFHDCESDGAILRGYYSHIEPFETEHLVEGITTKTLHKRIKSCEFISNGVTFFLLGDAGAKKLLSAALSALSGVHADIHKFESVDLDRIQNKMARVKSVSVINPKEKDVRRCKMSGYIEEYTEYNVLDPKNHGLESVSGMIDTPMGPMTLTATNKGAIRLGVKKGMKITFDLLTWVFGLIIGKHEGKILSLSPIGESEAPAEEECDEENEADDGELQPDLPFAQEPEDQVVYSADPDSPEKTTASFEEEPHASASSDGP